MVTTEDLTLSQSVQEGTFGGQSSEEMSPPKVNNSHSKLVLVHIKL